MHVWDASGTDKSSWCSSPLDSRFLRTAAHFLGWGYRWDSAPACRPFAGGHLTKGFTGRDRTTYCGAFVITVLDAVFPDAAWDERSYGDLQMYGDRLPDHPDAPVDAVVRAGLAERATAFNRPGWYVVQGWRKVPSSGHTMLVRVDLHGDLWCLQAAGGVGPTWGRVTKSPTASWPAGLYLARLLEKDDNA